MSFDDLFEEFFGEEKKEEKKTAQQQQAPKQTVQQTVQQQPRIVSQPEQNNKSVEDLLNSVGGRDANLDALLGEQITVTVPEKQVQKPQPTPQVQQQIQVPQQAQQIEVRKEPPPIAPRETPQITELAQKTEQMLAEMEEEEIEFDFSEDTGQAKEVHTIYGLKGHGKTYLTLTYPGTIVVLSFDRKAALVKQKCFAGENRIIVYDCVKYLDYGTPQNWLKTAEITFKYINALLDRVVAKIKPDWIVIDGSEIFQQICEMTMRYRNNLMPFQGIANRNLWKERRMYIRQVYNKCLSIAQRGVIFTTYIDKDEIVVEGEFIAKKDVPKWIDVIMYETDVVIKVEAMPTDSGKKYYAIIESSKTKLPSGVKVDITDRGFPAILEVAGLQAY